MNLKEQLKEDLVEGVYNEDEIVDKVAKNIHEVFVKLVVRGCFKTDRDYNVAKQTLLEMTGIDYEQEIG